MIGIIRSVCIISCLTLSIASNGQQVADTTYNPPIHNPAYQKGQGSSVVIDEAHSNFHTKNGRFKPFAMLLERDGYVVKSNTEKFSQNSLSSGKILVIANALHPDNEQRWSLPTPSAFTDEEISAVNQWVKNGGSLFLIADHMPFPGAAEKLALSFGIKFYNGFAQKKGLSGKDVFKPSSGLVESAITKGRNVSEAVTTLQSFTGQAFETSEQANPIIVLNKQYEILLPETAWEFNRDTKSISGENLIQGAYFKYGSGRVIVFGEAAMFTAQLQGKNKMGMNSSSASQNYQFVLNCIHWLDGLIETN